MVELPQISWIEQADGSPQFLLEHCCIIRDYEGTLVPPPKQNT